MAKPFICPQCGYTTLVLREYGSYGGARTLLPDGQIMDDSYVEHYSQCDGFALHCPICDYDDPDVDVVDERVVLLDAE